VSRLFVSIPGLELPRRYRRSQVILESIFGYYGDGGVIHATNQNDHRFRGARGRTPRDAHGGGNLECLAVHLHEGDSIAVGFGRTPVSRGDEIRLAARTNIWGKAKGDVKQLKSVKSGAPIKVEKAG
jgi:hypothetical protein